MFNPVEAEKMGGKSFKKTGKLGSTKYGRQLIQKSVITINVYGLK